MPYHMAQLVEFHYARHIVGGMILYSTSPLVAVDMQQHGDIVNNRGIIVAYPEDAPPQF